VDKKPPVSDWGEQDEYGNDLTTLRYNFPLPTIKNWRSTNVRPVSTGSARLPPSGLDFVELLKALDSGRVR
jgi:hypothetical protein